MNELMNELIKNIMKWYLFSFGITSFSVRQKKLRSLLRGEFPITLQAKNEKNKPILAVSGT